MNFEDITLGEIGSPQRTNTVWFHLYEVSQIRSVAQSWPTLCDPVYCSPPGSSVRGILQARILEWLAISSRGSSPPRARTWISCISYIGRRVVLCGFSLDLELPPQWPNPRVRPERICYNEDISVLGSRRPRLGPSLFRLGVILRASNNLRQVRLSFQDSQISAVLNIAEGERDRAYLLIIQRVVQAFMLVYRNLSPDFHFICIVYL